MLRRVALVQALAGALLLLAGGAAGAHTFVPEPTHAAPAHTAPVAATPEPAAIGATAPSADGTLWPWLALTAWAVAGARRRAPRPLAAALVLVLLVFAGESAVHSAHHNVAGDQTTPCPIASAAAHVLGADVEPVAVAAPGPALGPAHVEPGPPAGKLRPDGPHQGRAPPSALA